MFDLMTLEAAERLIDLCAQKKLTVATAESCTGGLVAGALTAIGGSSRVVDRGYVTYSNHAKQQMLGVTPATLDFYGAVSRECAAEMAKGALGHADVDLVVAITGIAGPTGGTAEKPVGLVHFAASPRGGPLVAHEAHYGDVGRAQVRRLSVLQALAMLTELAERMSARGAQSG
jgi:nicotinamide-nucleotide amidase